MWLKDRLKDIIKRNCDLGLKFLLKTSSRALRGDDDEFGNRGWACSLK